MELLVGAEAYDQGHHKDQTKYSVVPGRWTTDSCQVNVPGYITLATLPSYSINSPVAPT